MATQKHPLKITELILRDAHQSLLATRMRTEDMLPIGEKLDQVGFFSLETWGGATFDSCLRFLNEDPWERARKLKKVIPNTPFQMLLRGQNCVGYRHYADDIVERFVKKSVDVGIDIFRIFDALNDLRNVETAIKTVKQCGKIVEGCISYTVSPVHDINLYIKMAKQLVDMGSDIICIKDMAGLLTPDTTGTLIREIKKNVDLPIHLHTHATTGLVGMNLQCAIESGVDIVDTAISSLSMGAGHYPTECVVAAQKGTLKDTGLDLGLLEEISEYFREVRKSYSAFESDFKGVDINILKSQIPGGMISNMENQLRDQNALDNLGEVLEEVPRVRKDMGYPPLVTPTSQIVGSQATLNVLTGERYKIISKETRECVLGKYGKLRERSTLTCWPKPRKTTPRSTAGRLIFWNRSGTRSSKNVRANASRKKICCHTRYFPRSRWSSSRTAPRGSPLLDRPRPPRQHQRLQRLQQPRLRATGPIQLLLMDSPFPCK